MFNDPLSEENRGGDLARDIFIPHNGEFEKLF